MRKSFLSQTVGNGFKPFPTFCLVASGRGAGPALAGDVCEDKK